MEMQFAIKLELYLKQHECELFFLGGVWLNQTGSKLKTETVPSS